MDFSKAIENAQSLPEAPDDIDDLMDPTRSHTAGASVSRVAPGAEGKVENAVAYDMEYQCARLTIGQVQTGFDHTGPTFDDLDESGELQRIMNKSLTAEAVILTKETSFLKDGTIIIWIEWAEPKKPAPKQSGVLGIKELLSPGSSKPDVDSENPEDDSDSSLDETS